MRHWHWFQFISNGFLALFLGILAYVCIVAFSRHSGSTGLDVATIQKIRYENLPQNSSTPSSVP